MNKAGLATAILILTGILVSCGPSRQEILIERQRLEAQAEAKAWENAKTANNRYIYKNYLADYPHSIHEEEARIRLSEANRQFFAKVWEDAQKADTIEAYESYLHKYGYEPNNPFPSKEANKRISELILKEAAPYFTIKTAKATRAPHKYVTEERMSMNMTEGASISIKTANIPLRDNEFFLVVTCDFSGYKSPKRAIRITAKDIVVVNSDGTEITGYMLNMIDIFMAPNQDLAWRKDSNITLGRARTLLMMYVLTKEQLAKPRIRFHDKVQPVTVTYK